MLVENANWHVHISVKNQSDKRYIEVISWPEMSTPASGGPTWQSCTIPQAHEDAVCGCLVPLLVEHPYGANPESISSVSTTGLAIHLDMTRLPIWNIVDGNVIKSAEIHQTSWFYILLQELEIDGNSSTGYCRKKFPNRLCRCFWRRYKLHHFVWCLWDVQRLNRHHCHCVTRDRPCK